MEGDTHPILFDHVWPRHRLIPTREGSTADSARLFLSFKPAHAKSAQLLYNLSQTKSSDSSTEQTISFPIAALNMENYPQGNKELVKSLSLMKHTEGGYFYETDRREVTIPSPFAGKSWILSIFGPNAKSAML